MGPDRRNSIIATASPCTAYAKKIAVLNSISLFPDSLRPDTFNAVVSLSETSMLPFARGVLFLARLSVQTGSRDDLCWSDRRRGGYRVDETCEVTCEHL